MAELGGERIDNSLEFCRIDLLAGIEPEFNGALPFNRPHELVQLVPVSHLHVGDTFIGARVDSLRPDLRIVDELSCVLFAFLNSALCIPFGLQYLLNGLLGTGGNVGSAALHRGFFNEKFPESLRGV